MKQLQEILVGKSCHKVLYTLEIWKEIEYDVKCLGPLGL